MIRYFSFMAPYDWWSRRRFLRIAQEAAAAEFIQAQQPHQAQYLPLEHGGERQERIEVPLLRRTMQIWGRYRAAYLERKVA